VPFARNPKFWRLCGYAVVIGLFGGVATWVFTKVVAEGTKVLWPDEIDYEFLGGEVWWIGVIAGAGLVVGLLRRLTRVPEDVQGAFPQIEGRRIDYRTAPQTVLVSAISLIGGASVGPFDAGTRQGGAFAEWLSSRRKLPEDMREVNALSGINGGIGALLTAPFIALLFVMELARPKSGRYYFVLIPNLIAATFGFFVFFAIAGVGFLELFKVPTYEPEIWHFAAAIPLGAVAAAITMMLGLTMRALKALLAPLENQIVLRATLGGAVLGLVAFLIPLTIASGKDQLVQAIGDFRGLGTALLVVAVLAKIFAMAVSITTGFIGGAVMPTLFIGGAAGLAAHLIVPGLPLGLTFSALLVAVPGATVKAPFAMILLAAFTVGIGPIATAPAGVAVITAYLLTSGLGVFGTPSRTPVDPDDDLQAKYQKALAPSRSAENT
jgi:H+/Cl- antiporter ClcA